MDELILILQLGDASIQIGGSDSPYRLLASGLTGIESAEAALTYSDHAQLDGSTLLSCRVPGREISIRFEIADYAQRERHRAELQSFFMPRRTGVLCVIRNGCERKIGVSLNGRVEMTQETLFDYIRVYVPLYCPDPFFYADALPYTITPSSEALLTFPLTVTDDIGVTAGKVFMPTQMTVFNHGDMETGFLLTITAVEQVQGEGCRIVNPTLTRNSDGAYIRILETLTRGDVLTICTLPGAKYILLNGEKRMHFDCGSTFFSLPVGTTTLSLSSDAAIGNMEACLAWRSRHNGA